jgi:D-alanyl-D-alanine carboxypeptidase
MAGFCFTAPPRPWILSSNQVHNGQNVKKNLVKSAISDLPLNVHINFATKCKTTELAMIRGPTASRNWNG